MRSRNPFKVNKMNAMKFFRITLISLAATLSPATADASITINQLHYVVAYASDGVGLAAQTNFNSTAIPTSTSLDANDGTAYSRNRIEWSTVGGQTILSFDMDHRRESTLFAVAQTYMGVLTFTANANAPYQLFGYYNV